LHDNTFPNAAKVSCSAYASDERQHEAGKPQVVSHLVIDRLIKILDEDIPLTSLTEGRIALGPHDPATVHAKFKSNIGCCDEYIPCATFDDGIIELLQGALAIGRIEVINIRISQRATRNRIAANSDASSAHRYQNSNYTTARVTHLATGPSILKISKSIASVTVGSSSPTYNDAEGAGCAGAGGLYVGAEMTGAGNSVGGSTTGADMIGFLCLGRFW
jgi:hypothetical protein